MILFVFYSFYYVANPEFVFPLASGVVVGFVSEVLIIAILAGVRVLDTGISDVSIKAVAVIGTIVNILFAIKINTGTGGNIIINFLSSLPKFTGIIVPVSDGQIQLGMGLLYPTAYDIFVISDMGLLGYIGFIFISGITTLALVSGILIAFGGGE
jgi:hypothetical protein